MHAVIYVKDSNEIKYVVKNCVKKGRHFIGDNIKVGINTNNLAVIWTDDTINPITDQEGNTIGWDKNISELTHSTNITEVMAPSRSEFITAIKVIRFISDKSYKKVDNYIENNVTNLASAKEFLKDLSKVVLALSKLANVPITPIITPSKTVNLGATLISKKGRRNLNLSAKIKRESEE